MLNNKFYFLLLFLFTACKVGPDYQKPAITTPEKFQESGVNWKIAAPQDRNDRGEWWKIYQDPALNELEQKLNKNNYNIKAALNNYNQALAIVEKTRMSYLPSMSMTQASTRGRPTASSTPLSATHNWQLNASWTPDLWSNISRQVESAQASAGLAMAELASARLASQASLAQYYYELLMLDKNQELLNKIVRANQQNLVYTQNRYKQGVDDDMAIQEAEQQLTTAKTQAINNKINRAQYQHAIAVLIGESPSNFILTNSALLPYPPVSMPAAIPSEVLQRRPDVAEAERQVAIANAQIGIIQSGFFPLLSLSSNLTYQGTGLARLFSVPTFLWSVGPQLALSLSELASYKSATTAAKESYKATVANYIQTVLAAFQNVEDNLVALKILLEQTALQKQATEKAHRIFTINQNQYQSGIIDQGSLLTAEIDYYTALLTLNGTEGLKITTSVALITSLGGGWQ